MTPEQVVAIVSSFGDGRWMASVDVALVKLQQLGFGAGSLTVTELSSGMVQREVEPAAGIDHASLSSLGGEPTSIVFFVASAPEPRNVGTIAAHDELVASLSEVFGLPERVWEDQPSPLLWRVAELDIGVQLFDRHDSSVMVWVEHRTRSEIADRRIGYE